VRLTVTTKLLIGFLAISLLVVLVGAFSYRITQEIVYSFRGSEEHFRSVVTEATEAAIQIKEAESQLMLYVILGDEGRRGEFQRRRESFEQRMALLDAQVKVPKARKVFGEMKEHARAFSVTSGALLQRYHEDVTRMGSFRMSAGAALLRDVNAAASKVREAGVRLAQILGVEAALVTAGAAAGLAVAAAACIGGVDPEGIVLGPVSK
jgi:CHASE3 domain sensor protein